MPGSGCTDRARSPAITIAPASITVPPMFHAGLLSGPVAAEYDGSSIISAEIAETTIITCCACEVPIHGIRTKLTMSDPRIAPTVFAAYTPPAIRAESCSLDATAPSASGKLAPHRIAPGRTTQNARTRSSCSVYHGEVEIDGFVGQYGNDPGFRVPAP